MIFDLNAYKEITDPAEMKKFLEDQHENLPSWDVLYDYCAAQGWVKPRLTAPPVPLFNSSLLEVDDSWEVDNDL